jgi:hypothetical protein
MKAAGAALEDALVAEVRSREKNVRLPALPSENELVQMTRTRVEPMVRGLFPKAEQALLLGILEKSLVFLTPGSEVPSTERDAVPPGRRSASSLPSP